MTAEERAILIDLRMELDRRVRACPGCGGHGSLVYAAAGAARLSCRSSGPTGSRERAAAEMRCGRGGARMTSVVRRLNRGTGEQRDRT
jgi:hypothetical protein